MKKFLAIFFGNLWMAPNTIVTAIYLGIFSALGWIKFEGFSSWGIKFLVIPDSKLSGYMIKGNWGAWASGVFIIGREKYIRNPVTIVHEERHIKQQMVFGILQPVLYVLFSIFIWAFIWKKHSYFDNPFEIDARKAAGQRVHIPREYWKGDRWSWW